MSETLGTPTKDIDTAEPVAAKSGTSGLIKKLALVLQAVDYVEKRGQNQKQGYAYQRASDLARSVRGEMAKQNILLIPKSWDRHTELVTTQAGGQARIEHLMGHFEFIDGDTGEVLEVMIPSSGYDTGDKGIFKAITGSLKYVLKTVFLVPEEADDPEADTKAERSKARETNPAPQTAKPTETVGSPKEPPNVYLEPGKQGFCTITGDGLAVLLTKLFETEKTILGLAYDGNFWTVPIANAFRFADACVKHGVGVVHMDSGAAKSPAPNGGGAQPSPASPSKIIKGTFPKSGETKATKEKPARKWACLEVIWGDQKHICWDSTLWPYLEDAGRKKLAALLQTTKSFDGKKSPTIEGILRIGDTEFEVIEGRSVPVIQRGSSSA